MTFRTVTAGVLALASAVNLTAYIDGSHSGPNLFAGIFTGLLCIIAAALPHQPRREADR